MPKTPELFNEIATNYEKWSNLLSAEGIRAWHRFAVDTMHLMPGIRVLDVGCGTGIATRLMAQRVGVHGEVTGLDPARTMLTQAMHTDTRDDSAPIQWVVGRGEQLPFDDASFDRVTAQFSLRNMEDWTQGIREMVRVLKDQGQLTILEMVQPTTTMGILARRGLNNLTETLGHLVPTPYQWLGLSLRHAPTTDELRSEVKRVGLASIATHHWLGDLVVVLNGVKEGLVSAGADCAGKQVVVWAVDGSVTSLHASRWINQCVDSVTQVHIVSVIPPTHRGDRIRETDRLFWVQQQNKANALLTPGRYHVETHLLEGSPGPQVVRFAQDIRANLVVIGTKHRHPGTDHWVGGSVTQYVFAHAERPVLIIPTDFDTVTPTPL